MIIPLFSHIYFIISKKALKCNTKRAKNFIFFKIYPEISMNKYIFINLTIFVDKFIFI